MQKPRINAHIQEIGPISAYYPVHLTWVPRVGELIQLTSFLDIASGHQSMHWFEVVQILHEVHDVVDGDEQTYGADHFVRVMVREVSNKGFAEAQGLGEQLGRIIEPEEERTFRAGDPVGVYPVG